MSSAFSWRSFFVRSAFIVARISALLRKLIFSPCEKLLYWESSGFILFVKYLACVRFARACLFFCYLCLP